ncbi:MAG: excinuclease ABC subunit UvrB [Planctomycetes bacterium]|nr:excinuclease ABC subunit UvrB [Planctomycetota bacterium]MCP4838801.1 excinuclease ABC subunit UvrB [Planctomycetota bacterium]
MTAAYRIEADYQPTGDQPAAISQLVAGVQSGVPSQVLLGATGTGKTFTMANVIAETSKPALVISHNKTLAAQLYEEFRALFPEAAVCYFVSYYDYYQPEAYIPQRDIYIEKDAARNDDLDRLRLSATSNLLSRSDVIVVASVSCIYGLGSPEAWQNRLLALRVGQQVDRRELLRSLTDMQYNRTEIEFVRGKFRVRGDVIEVFPAYEQFAVRIEFFGDDIERISLIHPTSGETLANEQQVFIFPAVHYVLPEERLHQAISDIREECAARSAQLKKEGKLLEAQRLMSRTRYDLEMLAEVGYCSGVENYARHLEGRPPGSRPSTLLDYFNHVPGREPNDWLVFIDESHVTIPQIRAMYNGDQARKQVLVDHGFRLPSALDNRPLMFDEFEQIVPQVIHVSATPADFELERAGGTPAEQVIRPTGLLDPVIEVRPASEQVPDFIKTCREVAAKGQRIIATVLTKRMAEDLAGFLEEKGLSVRYLHSDIDTLDRIEILKALREGDFDVLVGVNLLREGLDLPEVSLVCILDADKEGFLRSRTSLIQTIGRAARNVDASCIMYADRVTASMQSAIDETARRRAVQQAHNEKNGITPTTIVRAVRRGIERELQARRTARKALDQRASDTQLDQTELLESLEREMLEAADQLEFERAAALRDRLAAIRSGEGDPRQREHTPEPGTPRGRRRRSNSRR